MCKDNVTGALKAVEGIVKTVPIYEDTFQPAAKQIGKSLETVTKAINIALTPISTLVWGYEEIKGFIEFKIPEKLKNIPPEKIITPTPLVAGPLLEGLKYSGHEESLKEMYANLLANSMDSDTAKNSHPGFVEILKNLSPDEAKILKLFLTEDSHPLIDIKANIKGKGGFHIFKKNFSKIGIKTNCQHKELTVNYIDNLCRLGILEIPSGIYIDNDDIYKELQNSTELKEVKQLIENGPDWELGYTKKKINLTDFGKQFCKACVIDKNL